MQYKIPIQIENEDIVVVGLSMRQIIVMMLYGGAGYTIFKTLEPQIGPDLAAIVSVPIIIIGVIIALVKISEMTFLPWLLNLLRLSLNVKERIWSKGTDSYPEIMIGYVPRGGNQQKKTGFNKGSLESVLQEDTEDKFSKI